MSKTDLDEIRREIAEADKIGLMPPWVTELLDRVQEAEENVKEMERIVAEFQTAPEIAARWGEQGRDAERTAVVAWLRRDRGDMGRLNSADEIECGMHRKAKKP